MKIVRDSVILDKSSPRAVLALWGRSEGDGPWGTVSLRDIVFEQKGGFRRGDAGPWPHTGQPVFTPRAGASPWGAVDTAKKGGTPSYRSGKSLSN
jgi:hypothetical protein